MTLRNYQIHTLGILTLLFFCVPWIASAEGNFLQEVLWGIVVAFFGLFVGLAGTLLDIAINDYVIGFGRMFTTAGVGAAVDLLWYSVRDIFNITFIFGLVFIGLKMILNSDDSGTRRWLVNLIMAALLVNFSLFITKFIVDFSNIIATQIAQTLPTDNGGAVTVSRGFMDKLGLQSTLGVKYGDINSAVSGNGAYGYILGTMIMFIVMTFVFASGAILLLIRYAALCLYMVLSPLMFIGWVFPQLQSITSSYWKGFLGRAFFAPIYLLLVYFSYFVLSALFSEMSKVGKNPNYIKSMSGGGDNISSSFAGTFPPFILVCIFLISSIVVANKLGVDGASTALSMGNKAKSWTQRKATQYTKGTAKFAASQTAGRATRRASYAIGNRLNQQIDRVQQGNGSLGKIARSNFVEGSVRGSAVKMRDARFGLTRNVKQEDAMLGTTEAAARTRNEDAANLEQLKAARVNYTNAAATAADENRVPAEREEAMKRREQYRSEVSMRTKKLTDQQLTDMNNDEIMAISEHLSDNQIGALEKSGKYTNFGNGTNNLADIRNNRNESAFGDFTRDVGIATKSASELEIALKGLADTVKNLSDDRLKSTNIANLTDERIAMHLSEDQLKTLQVSGNFDATQINQIRAARENGIIRTVTQGSVVDQALVPSAADVAFQQNQRQNLFKKSTEEVGKLPVRIFKEIQSFDYLTPAMLESRLRNGVSAADQADIRATLGHHLGIDPGVLPSSVAHLKDNKWTKWQEGRSVLAAQFFS